MARLTYTEMLFKSHEDYALCNPGRANPWTAFLPKPAGAYDSAHGLGRDDDDLADLVKRLRALSDKDMAALREMFGSSVDDGLQGETEREFAKRVKESPEILFDKVRGERRTARDDPAAFVGRPRTGVGPEDARDRGRAMDAAPTSFAAALREVRQTIPTLAYDSNSTIAGVYGRAAQELGVHTAGIDPHRWPGMFRAARDRMIPSFDAMLVGRAPTIDRMGEPLPAQSQPATDGGAGLEAFFGFELPRVM